MGGSDDNELSLTSNIGGCGVIGAVYGGVKAAWALAPTGKYQQTVSCHMLICLSMFVVSHFFICNTKLTPFVFFCLTNVF